MLKHLRHNTFVLLPDYSQQRQQIKDKDKISQKKYYIGILAVQMCIHLISHLVEKGRFSRTLNPNFECMML